MRRRLLLVLLLSAAAAANATADPAKPPADVKADPAAATEDTVGLQATTAKFNAYVAYMNRTLRAIDSLDRYKSWVNMKTGPTGHERYIYGLYSVNDLRSERKDAEAELPAAPLLPDLDDAMRAYIAANEKLAPILNKADGYYSRADYKLDHMEQGKVFHAEIVEAGGAFLAARYQLEAVMNKQKLQFDMIRLATIEKREGRDARWQMTNVMMRGKQALDALHGGHGGGVDMATFDTDMKEFGTAVTALDDYRADHPDALTGFSSFPDDLLGHLRSVQGRLVRTHGDLRRSAGMEMTLILSDWNAMVTTSEISMEVDGK